MFDTEKARERLEELDQIDGPQTVAEARESQRLAQNLRLVDRYGVDPKEIDR
jgi:hypothetical protein